ncbi:hypothetical protein PCL_02022 [Purpureocillium lilacinum]|uniref:Uncharacterized protein n=1 Tax=Purpureocillium lilacinum TaxID=33203 RepID=A0A2U3E182_PURLI|nr:hypothetical protein PCL_02022 [Purpureocillium lilacinum]
MSGVGQWHPGAPALEPPASLGIYTTTFHRRIFEATAANDHALSQQLWRASSRSATEPPYPQAPPRRIRAKHLAITASPARLPDIDARGAHASMADVGKGAPLRCARLFGQLRRARAPGQRTYSRTTAEDAPPRPETSGGCHRLTASTLPEREPNPQLPMASHVLVQPRFNKTSSGGYLAGGAGRSSKRDEVHIDSQAITETQRLQRHVIRRLPSPASQPAPLAACNVKAKEPSQTAQTHIRARGLEAPPPAPLYESVSRTQHRE